MISLIYLYYRILINVYKDKFFSKNTLAGMIILTILSLFFISFGYFFGYLVVYLNYHAELKLGNLFSSIRQSFCIFSGVIILSNSLSPLKFITQHVQTGNRACQRQGGGIPAGNNRDAGAYDAQEEGAGRPHGG